MCTEFDSVQLNFSAGGLMILDITLAIIMYGVALSLKVSDFQALLQRPRAALVGITSQFFLLPALTLILVMIIRPCPSMALGMFLVAACPGGNISNFISQLARGNVALSVSLSAISTIASIIMTPFNFAFWAGFYPPASELLAEISMNPLEIFTKILLILGIPLLAGMWTAHRFPRLTARMRKPMQMLSIVIFGGYVVVALAMNFDFFLKYLPLIIPVVFLHNAVALGSGWGWARLFRLPAADRRTVSIETGIQNSGLGLVLIFSPIFGGLGGMAMIAALWGIWHIIAGLTLAGIWSRFSTQS
ncbi:MAG: bile acid:sodium symporter family protein [Bacteroidota bacterium]